MKEKIYLDAGKRIREVRERFGISRERLAAISGISTKHLYDIEVKGKGFTAQVLYDLSKHLRVSADYILGGIDVPNSLFESDKKREEVLELLNYAYMVIEK